MAELGRTAVSAWANARRAIGSKFADTAAMPGTGGAPIIDRAFWCAARIHAFLNGDKPVKFSNSALPVYGPCNQERALFGLFNHRRLGFLARDIFTVLSIRKKGVGLGHRPPRLPPRRPPGGSSPTAWGLQIIMKKLSALAFVRRTLARRYPGVGVAQPDPVALHYMKGPVRMRRARGSRCVLKAAGI